MSTCSDMAREYFNIDDRVKVLAAFIFHWAEARRVSDPVSGPLSSRCLLFCVIHFLQNRPKETSKGPILPVLQRIPENWNGSSVPLPTVPQASIGIRYMDNLIDTTACNVYFYKPDTHGANIFKALACNNKEGAFLLLCEFFRYFSFFDFDASTIRVSNVGVSSKQQKFEYFTWKINNFISIEHPFDPSHNVVESMTEFQMKHLRIEFMVSCLFPLLL